ncbi:MAG: P-loop NTPase family protein [Solirubrobacteraceae bacterium]
MGSAAPLRRVWIIASASGNGKTTLGRALAQRLAVPFVGLDSLVHGPGWTEASDEELRTRIEPVIASDGWVIDGSYQRKLGDLVLDAARPVIGLRSPGEVERFLQEAGAAIAQTKNSPVVPADASQPSPASSRSSQSGS